VRREVAVLEYYGQIRAVHIGAVFLSGALFSLRGAGALAGATWTMAAPLRYLSYAIDTVLLGAAVVLFAILPAPLFANHWLATKLALLILYMVLGSFALKRARTPWGRAVCYGAALTVFVLIVGIARAHHPLGWFAAAHSH
jgi:uncharacterized membrane protein SirB2